MYDHENDKIGYRYFGETAPYIEYEEGTYADPNADIRLKEYFWCHSLHEIIQPLLKEGLQLTDFQEFSYSPYECFPNMKKVGPRRWVYGDLENRMPHVFSFEMKG